MIDRALAIFDRAAGIVALALLVFMVLAIVYYGAFK